ncbi:MAG: (d)CMP kinase [Bacteroidia bacterium]|nr:(d)CMP kinase [Bacteroidia bacterium]
MNSKESPPEKNKKINIAIDGYSSCGKGTLAKQLAQHLNYVFIDSGSMYRAVTLFVLDHHIDPQDEASVERVLGDVDIRFDLNSETGRFEVVLNGVSVESRIRDLRVSSQVSYIAKISAVRRKLVEIQQKIGLNKGVVMDGRDIGTVVYPNAELKIFMTASSEVRADRRFAELEQAGQKVTWQEVFDNLVSRDTIDSSREDSPLTMSSDYRVLDNSDLSREEQFALAMTWVSDALNEIG